MPHGARDWVDGLSCCVFTWLTWPLLAGPSRPRAIFGTVHLARVLEDGIQIDVMIRKSRTCPSMDNQDLSTKPALLLLA